MIFLNRGLAISERKIAAAISKIFWVTMNAALYSTVFFVTCHALPDMKKKRKLFRPHHGLPKMPSLKLYDLNAMTAPAMGT